MLKDHPIQIFLRNFTYEGEALQIQAWLTESHSNQGTSIFRKTLVQKMSSKPDPLSDYPLAKASVYSNEPEKNIEQKYKTFIAPRDSMYIPKPQMFNRYNYENYNGYQYKNPFRPPQKYPIEDKVL